MNKEQIDEIAFKVARESNLRLDNACRCSTCRERYDPPRIKAFVHALLAELAKGSKPIRTAFLNKDGGVTLLMSRSDPSTHPEFKNYLYTTQPPQTDLVAEIELLKADLENERMRLAACGVAALGYFDGCNDEYKSASLSDTLRLYAANNELRQQLSAAQQAIATQAAEIAELDALRNDAVLRLDKYKALVAEAIDKVRAAAEIGKAMK